MMFISKKYKKKFFFFAIGISFLIPIIATTAVACTITVKNNPHPILKDEELASANQKIVNYLSLQINQQSVNEQLAMFSAKVVRKEQIKSFILDKLNDLKIISVNNKNYQVDLKQLYVLQIEALNDKELKVKLGYGKKQSRLAETVLIGFFKKNFGSSINKNDQKIISGIDDNKSINNTDNSIKSSGDILEIKNSDNKNSLNENSESTKEVDNLNNKKNKYKLDTSKKQNSLSNNENSNKSIQDWKLLDENEIDKNSKASIGKFEIISIDDYKNNLNINNDINSKKDPTFVNYNNIDSESNLEGNSENNIKLKKHLTDEEIVELFDNLIANEVYDVNLNHINALTISDSLIEKLTKDLLSRILFWNGSKLGLDLNKIQIIYKKVIFKNYVPFIQLFISYKGINFINPLKLSGFRSIKNLEQQEIINEILFEISDLFIDSNNPLSRKRADLVTIDDINNVLNNYLPFTISVNNLNTIEISNKNLKVSTITSTKNKSSLEILLIYNNSAGLYITINGFLPANLSNTIY